MKLIADHHLIISDLDLSANTDLAMQGQEFEISKEVGESLIGSGSAHYPSEPVESVGPPAPADMPDLPAIE